MKTLPDGFFERLVEEHRASLSFGAPGTSISAYDLLIHWRDKGSHLPYNVATAGHKGVPSNADIRRFLENRGGILINGEKPGPKDMVTFPITQLVYFPKGNRVTVL